MYEVKWHIFHENGGGCGLKQDSLAKVTCDSTNAQAKTQGRDEDNVKLLPQPVLYLTSVRGGWGPPVSGKH